MTHSSYDPNSETVGARRDQPADETTPGAAVASEPVASEPVTSAATAGEPVFRESLSHDAIPGDAVVGDPPQPEPAVTLPTPSVDAQPMANAAPAVTELAHRGDDSDSLAPTLEVIRRLQARLRAQVLGRDEVIDLVLVALLADGHVLLEDYPGSGKTTLAKTLGLSIDDPRFGERDDQSRTDNDTDTEIAPFRRIQFTPDLLPSDVTGVSIFDATTSRFQFRRGPLFAHVVLADEINRTSPKVQSAMLEAMAEKQVTVDNRTYPLDALFFVIATQNPLDLAGTYPLPAPQLDRFLFKIRMDHIDREAELRVLDTYRERRNLEQGDLPKVGRDDLMAARQGIEDHVKIDPAIKACLVDLSRNLRLDERVLQGNSTRSLVLMLPALQALAAVRGRDYVSADDVRVLAPRVLGHRIELAPGVAELDDVIRDAMAAPLEELARRSLRRR